MSGEPSKIVIDPASVSILIVLILIFRSLFSITFKKFYFNMQIISLKADLLRKQNEFRLKKLSNLKPEIENEYEIQKVKFQMT